MIFFPLYSERLSHNLEKGREEKNDRFGDEAKKYLENVWNLKKTKLVCPFTLRGINYKTDPDFTF